MFKWNDVKPDIDVIGFDSWIALNKQHANHISRNTASKTVYVFEDFVIKFGAEDCLSEWKLWNEVVESGNAVMQDLLIPILAIKESDTIAKYWTVQPKVDCGVDEDDWYDTEDTTHCTYYTFMQEINNAGYYVDDLHHLNVCIGADGFIRAFDYSWWRRF